MVVFTCNHCGEALHKPKVEKHYQFTCHNAKSVSCVDCFKDFRDEEYVAHIKCITEDERYAAKGTYKNGIVKKGEVKQESWMEMIKSICDGEKNLKPSILSLLKTISDCTNVPRKKQKFMNFIKSSSGNRANMKEVEEAWNIIENYKAKNAPSRQNKKNSNNTPEVNNQEQKNGIQEPDQQSKKRPSKNEENIEEESPKKRKKKSSEEIIEETNQDNSDENTEKRHRNNLEPFKGTKELFIEENEDTVLKKGTKKKNKSFESEDSMEPSKSPQEHTKFDYKNKILEILTKKQSISLSKLQKKIVKAYQSDIGESDCEEKVMKRFNKKLKKISNVKIENGKVILLD